MNKISGIALAVTFTILLVGCDQGESNIKAPAEIEPPTGSVDAGTGGNTTTQDPLHVTFDLPEGWKWLDQESLEAIWEHEAKGNNAPFVKLEFGGIEKGTPSEAEAKIKETYNTQMSACEASGEECPEKPTLEKLNIAKIDVFAAMSTGHFWGEPSWSSHLAFSKNGYIVELMLYDKATLHQTELETIIGSLSW